jgi:hypothetical protein
MGRSWISYSHLRICALSTPRDAPFKSAMFIGRAGMLPTAKQTTRCFPPPQSAEGHRRDVAAGGVEDHVHQLAAGHRRQRLAPVLPGVIDGQFNDSIVADTQISSASAPRAACPKTRVPIIGDATSAPIDPSLQCYRKRSKGRDPMMA